MNDNRKRRWYQYRLRTLLLFTLVVGLGLCLLLAGMGFGLLGRKIGRIRNEAKATAELVEFEARVSFREIEELPISDRYLRKWFGGGPVMEVRLGRSITDTGLEHLKGLTNLKRLQLGHTQITDAGLENLKDATNLEKGYALDSTDHYMLWFPGCECLPPPTSL